jgi:hypothetical protein
MMNPYGQAGLNLIEMKILLLKFLFICALVFFSVSLVMSGVNAGRFCQKESPICSTTEQTGEEDLNVELSGGLSLAFL